MDRQGFRLDKAITHILIPHFIGNRVSAICAGAYSQYDWLADLKSKYLTWIGGVFLLSTVLFLSHISISFLSWAKATRQKANAAL